ncbi:8918_t:CDS:1, partial [Diversispora eburnea]
MLIAPVVELEKRTNDKTTVTVIVIDTKITGITSTTTTIDITETMHLTNTVCTTFTTSKTKVTT